MRVFLDIGHGEDTWEKTHGKGIVRADGTVFEEHHFNAKVFLSLKKKLEAIGIEVDYVQEPNKSDINLYGRVKEINKRHQNKKYDILISLHANANNSPVPKGYDVFYWHNNMDGFAFAKNWVKNAKEMLDIRPLGDGITPCIPKTWTNFYMVRATLPTAILIEHFFFTNPEELKKCYTDEYIDKFSDVTVKTICDFFEYDVPEKETKEITVTQAIKDIRKRLNLTDDEIIEISKVLK